MLKGNSFLVYTNLFSPKKYVTNDITEIFSITKNIKIKKIYFVIFRNHKKFKYPKISYIIGKTLILSIICSKCQNEDQQIFKEKESTEILKIIGLFKNIKWLKAYGWRKHKPRI